MIERVAVKAKQAGKKQRSILLDQHCDPFDNLVALRSLVSTDDNPVRQPAQSPKHPIVTMQHLLHLLKVHRRRLPGPPKVRNLLPQYA